MREDGEKLFTEEVGKTDGGEHFSIGIGKGNVPWQGKRGTFSAVGWDRALFQTGVNDFIYLRKDEVSALALALARVASRMDD